MCPTSNCVIKIIAYWDVIILLSYNYMHTKFCLGSSSICVCILYSFLSTTVTVLILECKQGVIWNFICACNPLYFLQEMPDLVTFLDLTFICSLTVGERTADQFGREGPPVALAAVPAPTCRGRSRRPARGPVRRSATLCPSGSHGCQRLLRSLCENVRYLLQHWESTDMQWKDIC